MDVEWLLQRGYFGETGLLATNGFQTLAINYRRIGFRGWGDDPVSPAFVMEERGLEFGYPEPMEKLSAIPVMVPCMFHDYGFGSSPLLFWAWCSEVIVRSGLSFYPRGTTKQTIIHPKLSATASFSTGVCLSRVHLSPYGTLPPWSKHRTQPPWPPKTCTWGGQMLCAEYVLAVHR